MEEIGKRIGGKTEKNSKCVVMAPWVARSQGRNERKDEREFMERETYQEVSWYGGMCDEKLRQEEEKER